MPGSGAVAPVESGGGWTPSTTCSALDAGSVQRGNEPAYLCP